MFRATPPGVVWFVACLCLATVSDIAFTKFESDTHGPTAIWPVNAVALTLLFLGRGRRTAPVLLGFASSIAVSALILHDPPRLMAIIIPFNTLEVALTYWVTAYALKGRKLSDSLATLVGFWLICLTVCLVNAVPVIFAEARWFARAPMATLLSWGIGDALGLMLVTPALLDLVSGKDSQQPADASRAVDLLAIGTLSAGYAAICLFRLYTLEFIILLIFVMIAYWRGRSAVAAGILSAIVVADVALNFAVHAGPEPVLYYLNDKLYAQLFLLGCALATFPMASAVQKRRELEQALTSALEDYRALADHSTDLILRIDAQDVIEYVSPAIVHLLGFDPAEVIGLRVADLIHPDERPAHAERLEGMRAGLGLAGGPSQLRFRARDGGWRWLESAPSAVNDEAGRPIGVVSVLRDVTERQAMEAALRRKTVEAEAAAVAKADFLANMSHEIRTPLTGVLGYAGLLGAIEGLPPIARGHVGRIVASGQTLLAIVNDILDFSKLEAGQIELDPQPFDPAVLLADAAELMRPQAEGKGLSIGVETGEPLPAVVVADSARLRQVLINLLGNAVKFTARGGVAVTARHDAELGRLRIAVRDTGIGIPPEQAHRLFQRFYQVDASSTRRFGGAGLGLAISRALVEAMGGEIGVESRIGEGSTFWFEVPAPAGTRAAEIAADDGEAVRIEPLKILLVDDVAANRELVGCMLAPFDIDIAEAANGLEAVEAAMRTRFDLVLMDLQMPGMDGLAATRAIRANAPLNRDAPILALSANVLAAQVDACRQAGMNDHVAKPINPKDLLAKIARWTDAGEATVEMA